MSAISGQGTKFTWGTSTFLLTSVSVQIGGQGDIDITSMSSKTVQDDENTGKWLVHRDVDVAFAGEADVELSVEFLAEAWIKDAKEMVGRKRNLVMSFPADDEGEGEGFSLSSKAVLRQMSLGVSTGEFVAGSATFRLSGD
jgi:hypothetical protein